MGCEVGKVNNFIEILKELPYSPILRYYGTVTEMESAGQGVRAQSGLGYKSPKFQGYK